MWQYWWMNVWTKALYEVQESHMWLHRWRMKNAVQKLLSPENTIVGKCELSGLTKLQNHVDTPPRSHTRMKATPKILEARLHLSYLQ